MPKHPIAYPESFHLRRPVLEAAKSLKNWNVVDGGKALEIEHDLGGLSKHERDVVEFVLDPYYTAANIFHGLDRETQQALAKAIYDIFGQGAIALA